MSSDLWRPREIFEEDHEAFRQSARAFAEREIAPNVEQWEEAAETPRGPWERAGALGFLGTNVPEPYGGGGAAEDFRFRMVVIEELCRVGAASFNAGTSVHADIVLPYLVNLATPEQAQRWLPPMSTGQVIGAIAMTEPGAGSDLQGIRTRAVRDGDVYVLDGAKTFISNGHSGGTVIVVARTNADASAGRRALSLLVVEEGMAGFSRGRKLAKLGLHGQDTAELTFEGVRVPVSNLLGEEGGGLQYLVDNLPLERLGIAVTACASARAAIGWTLDHVRDRTAFGQRIADFQNTRFALAEVLTEIDVTQTYVDDAVIRFNAGRLSAVDAAKAKWWATEMHKRVVDRCLQLFGGYGYMREFPIARAFVDTRVTTIFGGTTEIMKHIIAKDAI